LCTATANTVNVRPGFGCPNRVQVDWVPGVTEEYLAYISSTQKMVGYDTFFRKVLNAAQIHVISGLLHLQGASAMEKLRFTFESFKLF